MKLYNRLKELKDMMTIRVLLLVLLATCPTILPQQALAAKSRKDVPLAPLPAKVLAAKKIFLANGGGNDLAYDALYAAVKEWARYEIVDTSSAADIIMEIRYVTEDLGTRVWSTTNPSNGATNVHRRQVIDPQLVLTIFDPSSKEALWSTVEHRRLARLEKNREKETINAAQKLINNLKVRLGAN
jgi:hypothetical protein